MFWCSMQRLAKYPTTNRPTQDEFGGFRHLFRRASLLCVELSRKFALGKRGSRSKRLHRTWSSQPRVLAVVAVAWAATLSLICLSRSRRVSIDGLGYTCSTLCPGNVLRAVMNNPDQPREINSLNRYGQICDISDLGLRISVVQFRVSDFGCSI